MGFEDLYRPLIELHRDPVDASGRRIEEGDPDEVVYRLGFSSIPLAGMPDQLMVGRVEVHHALGPVFTQRTAIRQRHGIPIVFDKSMRFGVEVAENEVLTVCQIREAIPDNLGSAIDAWREEARSACGLLAAVLDDRVAIEERFEDVVLLHKGAPVSSADSRIRLRSYLPFDVRDEERDALAALSEVQLASVPGLAEASRWYLRAAQEGPTADAVVFLWISIEALTPERSTAPKTVEAMLFSAGFNPALLGEMSVGRLAGVRAAVVHEGRRDLPGIRDAFYRLETIVRVLIRQAARAMGGWPPALMVSVFGDRAAEVVGRGSHETVWHEDGLPPPEDPRPAGLEWESVQLPREAVIPPSDVSIVGDIEPSWEHRALFWAGVAMRQLDVPFDPLILGIKARFDPDDGAELRVSREELMLRRPLFERASFPREMRLALIVHLGLAEMAVMRLGIASVSFGATLIELGGAWAVYRAFYMQDQPFAGQEPEIPDFADDDLKEVGWLTGTALAGGAEAARGLAEWSQRESVPEDIAAVFSLLVLEWSEVSTFGELLEEISELARHLRPPGK